ncbi:glycosyltransferase involved in cell wall biosynthesis [Silvibacterium bohemicum]|uniref:Glycosyltransferase involved in cell wall biosynthesis n=1 Tax=Silvibacterium bohemicum TaxID=1577686 RepID=A0A841JYQ0_9BACT|nr:glycosyltransferase family 2 protein [Silvibacterium bohemicum]MBB6146593.1 glycosyltransferase involved in cell wall biosynthesis [Silvibacterium bohemicum]
MSDIQAIPVRFSLIVATVDRVEPLHRLLASLAAQAFRDFEVILVDQNTDDRLDAVLEQWAPTVACRRIRSARGLSRARNAGILQAQGELICFPDDDCWYPSDLLARIDTWFRLHIRTSLLSVGARDEKGAEVSVRWPRNSCPIDRMSVLRTCPSFCLFVRRRALGKAGDFDEEMGLGSGTKFQSGEETDLALRVLESSGPGWFEKSLWAWHPSSDPRSAPSSRALTYGIGFGYLLRKHNYGVQVWLYHVLRAFSGMGKAIIMLRWHDARFYWNSAMGRITGYCSDVNLKNEEPVRSSTAV